MLVGISMAKPVRKAAKSKRAQSALEYTVIIACVVVGLVAMTKYIRRSMQGRLRETADELGQQYDPEKVKGEYWVDSASSVRDWTKTQTEDNVYIDLDEDNALEDVVYGTTSNKTIFSAAAAQTGGEDIY